MLHMLGEVESREQAGTGVNKKPFVCYKHWTPESGAGDLFCPLDLFLLKGCSTFVPGFVH